MADMEKIYDNIIIISLYLNNTTKGTDVTKANWNHELKMYARPAKIINATAKNKQIIIPAKVRYAGPMISRPIKKKDEKWKKIIIWKIRNFVETMDNGNKLKWIIGTHGNWKKIKILGAILELPA